MMDDRELRGRRMNPTMRGVSTSSLLKHHHDESHTCHQAGHKRADGERNRSALNSCAPGSCPHIC
jgi:hypothetical protein